MTIRRLTTALGGLLAFSLFALLLAVQFVPYRVSNPPVLENPSWDSARTEALARRACFDCHSNEVEVPWYGYVAPLAWLVRDHVDEGRAALNFSEMNRPQEDAEEATEEVFEGEMPPRYYVRLHPEARLTDAERRELAVGLDATLGGKDGEKRSVSEARRGVHSEDDDEYDDDD